MPDRCSTRTSVARARRPTSEPDSRVNPIPKISANRWALAACLFFIVLGSRWAVVNQFDTDLPIWDQWDAEGLILLAPWFQHHLTIGAFFQPHNEHRVVLTKLVNFGLTLANGQWDQRLEAAVNAILPGVIAAAFFVFGCRHLERRWHAPLFLLLAAAYALPLSWQNIVGGFHSQQFFLIGLSFGAIAWLPLAAPWSRSWWLGAAFAALALGSMASGFIAPSVVIGLLVVRLLRKETTFRAAGPAMALCAVLAVIGLLTQVSVPYHESLKAHSAQDFLLTVIHSLQWPDFWTAWSAVLIWLPWCWLTWVVFTDGRSKVGRRAPATPARLSGYTLAGLGGWVILQILATAYARGAGGGEPASRYIDTLLFGAVVNGLAVAWLWGRGAPARGSRILLAGLGVAWAVSFGAGVAYAVDGVMRTDLPTLKIYHVFCEQNTRNYLATGNEAYLKHPEIPYPSESALLERIRMPELQAVLPASVRIPLDLTTGGGGDAGFVQHDSRSLVPSPTGLSPATPILSNRVTWGSYGVEQASEGPAAPPQMWKSAPLRIRRPGWLRFEVAGQIGRPGVALELRNAGTGALLATAQPRQVPNDTWRSAYVPAPQGEFIVAARAESPGGWLAFSQPVEMANLSYWAWQAVKNGLWIAVISAFAALALGAIAFFCDE